VTSKIAFLFPGQGSQHPGMGLDLFENSPEARAAFEELDAALDSPISKLCFEGSDEELALTANTQPAILAHSVAAWRAVSAAGLKPDYVAGHSLGEYSALVAAGVLAAADAVLAVRRRGRYMQEAVPVGQGGMAAILGLDAEQVHALCEAARKGDEVLSPANFNSAGQVVIAGHAAAVDRAVAGASEAGARKAIPLTVSAPFHCAMMQPAADRLAPDLDALHFGAFDCPLISNVDARENEDSGAAREALKRQVTAPVLWEATVARLLELGVETFVELGPGKVLSGLVKRAARKAPLYQVATAGDVAKLAEALA
jgi:[acyl-carrier-protein] S-malonyltransferase